MAHLPKSFSMLPDIQHELELAELLSTYEHQCREGRSPDPQLLVQADQILATRVQDDPLSLEVVHLLVKFCSLFKDYARPLAFLTRYLTQVVSVEEEAWTRWQLVDHLALLKCYEEAYQQQQALFAWAAVHFPEEERIWTISDSTQAHCWLALGRGKEWGEWCATLLSGTPRTKTTRHERYCTLRTAADMSLELGEIRQAEALISQIRQLAQEDREWEDRFAVTHEAYLFDIKVAATLHHMHEVRRIAQELALLQKEPHRQNEKEWGYAHNLGAVMYFLQQYDLAVPPLRRAISQGSWSEHTYLWLAAALWADETEREEWRAEVLALLSRGTQLATGGSAWEEWRSLPEFEHWRDDSAFVQATRGKRVETARSPLPKTGSTPT